jgi:hypothetical protein
LDASTPPGALAAILGAFMHATLYGVRRSVIEYPAPSMTISCYEKLDHLHFSALCSSDDASFVCEQIPDDNNIDFGPARNESDQPRNI